MKTRNILAAVAAAAVAVSTMAVNVFAAEECAYTDGTIPSASYEVVGDVSQITANIVYSDPVDDGNTFGFNDWCGNGVIVTLPDGTKNYYQWGGAQVTWGWDATGDKEDDSVGGINGNTWLGEVVDNQATLRIPVEKGATVDFLCLGWDSYAGTQYTVDIDAAQAVVAEAAAEAPAAEATTTDAPATGNAPIAGMAAVMALAGAAAIASKKRN